jgi:hypothetical protein
VKVGDLVMLSSYGRDLSRTGWIRPNDIGIVMKVHNHFQTEYFEVQWAKSHFGWKRSGWINWGHEKKLYRKDLKKVRYESR